MTKEEGAELTKQIEHFAYKKLDKDPKTAYREGFNYGLMMMFEIAKEIIERKVKE